MLLANIFETTLPLVNPVLKFLLILIIILFAPIILNKIKIPHLLGLIIAGAFIGPHGLFIIERDSSIILSGTAGLLYIMFLAGLEINLTDFKKNGKKSLVFGLYTFSIPMTIGIITSYYLLGFSMITSVLLASMFASHTLITYPIVSKLHITKNRSVTIAIGGTLITDILALLVLAIIVGMTKGVVDTSFWIKLITSIITFGLVIMLLFPIIGRWFLKRYEDNVSQYIFVLVMVFLGAVLAEMAGIEAIIGAFLSGLALNRLIPHVSPLMNRIEFVGNAIFIPFFLISVGMLINYEAFFKDYETIKVAIIMTVVATLSKYLAAWATKQTFRLSADELKMIFGLSNSQAAATLAAVLVGYNIVLGVDKHGESIRLLNESVLNGTILMILITCTIASFVTQNAAKNIALTENLEEEKNDEDQERILIPIGNTETVEGLINLSLIIKSSTNKNGLYALSIVSNNNTKEFNERKAKDMLQKASMIAATTDNRVIELLRYDINIGNGISSVINEHKISDLILGLHVKKGLTDSFLGYLTEEILNKCNSTTFIYKAFQPISTVKRHLILVPEKAEKEIGFPFWLFKIWNIALNTSAQLVFYSTKETLDYIRDINFKHPVKSEFVEFLDWNDFLVLSHEIKQDDNLIVVLSRKDKVSYNSYMEKIPTHLNKYFQSNNFILIYPMQLGVNDKSSIDLKNPSILEPIEKLDEIGKNIARLFKKK